MKNSSFPGLFQLVIQFIGIICENQKIFHLKI